MNAPDGQVPAPRRAGRPSELPFAVPAAADASRVPELSALLADIDAMRLTLQTDLSLAAAALEAGADELAGELVEGDLASLRAFAARSTARLDRLAAADVPADELAVVGPVRKRRVLSAGPLMAAAAALIGFVVFGPSRATQAPDVTMSNATIAGLELSRLAEQGAPDEELALAAEELNDELAALIAQAADDPLAAQQALMLLDQTTEVLASQGNSGVLRSVMAETRALRQRLREALPVVQRPARAVRPVTRPVVPLVPRVQEQPKDRPPSSSSSSAPKASPKPAATPKPTQAPPAPSPSPEAPKATPAPSSEPEGPLPQPDDLPGA